MFRERIESLPSEHPLRSRYAEIVAACERIHGHAPSAETVELLAANALAGLLFTKALTEQDSNEAAEAFALIVAAMRTYVDAVEMRATEWLPALTADDVLNAHEALKSITRLN